MKNPSMALLLVFGWLVCPTDAQQTIEIQSPGLSPSRMDADGLLVEDWGTVDVQLSGEGVTGGAAKVIPITLDQCIPAAQAVSEHGAVRMTRTAYRAPVHPAGVDVLTVELTEAQGRDRDVLLTLKPSAGTRLGERTARIGGRTVLVLPRDITDRQELLDWGFCDEASALPGWAKPQGKCDSAFRNIRAGMGGVPIVYRFAVTPGSRASVTLGLCESHWDSAGRRPVRCRVEGAEPQTVDPVGKWGQHQPGLLTFNAQDTNGDGIVELSVRSAPHASDRNPILNAIWIYPPDDVPPPDQILSGTANDAALYYVDVGGKNDQSIYPPGKMEFSVHLTAGETQPLTFLVACPGSSAPSPTSTTWNLTTLRRAARSVWQDWRSSGL